LADGLYAQAPFFNLLLAHGKHALVVLKDERRDLYQDACGLFAVTRPAEGKYRSRHCQWWDVPDLTSWPQVNAPVRVIRSRETYQVRRQTTKQVESITTDWVWATTLPVTQAATEQAVGLGHRRWDIENYGFNELANEWHADHVYKHHPKAIESFLLLAFLAYNLFHAFWLLNLKPAIRRAEQTRCSRWRGIRVSRRCGRGSARWSWRRGRRPRFPLFVGLTLGLFLGSLGRSFHRSLCLCECAAQLPVCIHVCGKLLGKIPVQFFRRSDKAQRRRERSVFAFFGALGTNVKPNGGVALPSHRDEHSALGEKRHEFCKHECALLGLGFLLLNNEKGREGVSGRLYVAAGGELPERMRAGKGVFRSRSDDPRPHHSFRVPS